MYKVSVWIGLWQVCINNLDSATSLETADFRFARHPPPWATMEQTLGSLPASAQAGQPGDPTDSARRFVRDSMVMTGKKHANKVKIVGLTISPRETDNEILFREDSPMIKTTVFVLLFVGSCLVAPSGQAQSQPSTKAKGQVTVQGCVSRQSEDYILIETDPGNSYVLHAAESVKLGQYLGQQVKVTGTKSPTLSDSSDAARSTAGVTLTVSSIKTISKECASR
jgi:hypothetical protein